MELSMRRWLRSIVLVVLVGCGGPNELPGDGGTTADGGRAALEAAPKGGGFCCPIDSQSCSGMRLGGWTATGGVEQCIEVADVAPPFEERLDEHGCKYIIGAHTCIGMVPSDGGSL
jgi:hypothetical protein